MDQIVLDAMAKWPNVPDVFGWLALDGRGRWRLRGDPITNPSVVAFINRNYMEDKAGRWYFQNGPQRVFVALEHAPWVVRVEPHELIAHTGRHLAPKGFLCDDAGHLYAETDAGLARIDDRDLGRIADQLSVESHDRLEFCFAGRTWHVATVATAELPQRYGFIITPLPDTA